MHDLETPPKLIETKVFSAMPDKFRRNGVTSAWAEANRPGQPTDCFIEGPAFDADGHLWRLPFMKDGSVSKVGRFCSLFGTSGPDGMTMDGAGRLFVAHASLGHVFVFAPNGEMIARIKSCAGPSCTNVAIGGTHRDRLYVTESASGSVLVADVSVLNP